MTTETTPKNPFPLLFILSLQACSTHGVLVADTNLIRPYYYEDQRSEQFEAPYISIFKTEDKDLYFIAARHQNSTESPTFKTVKKAIDGFNPKFVIVEGFEFNNEISPQWYVEVTEKCNKGAFVECGESGYAAWLAHQKGIPFAGGEPKYKDVNSQLMEKGFAATDILAYYVVRQAPQWQRANQIDSKLQSRIESLIKYELESFPPETHFTYQDFLAWYEKNIGKPFDAEKIDQEDVAPITKGNTTILNKLAHETGMVREHHIAKLMEKMINQYHQVLIVYGSGHLVQERPMLQKIFKSHENRKWF